MTKPRAHHDLPPKEKKVDALLKIGYFVPEFPGQTHNFFWREIEELRSMGAELVLLSTRLPPPALRSTSWGDTAIHQTMYLVPLGPSDLMACLLEVFRLPAGSLVSALKSVWRKGDHGQGRLNMFMLMFVSLRFRQIARLKGIDHVHVHSCANAANIAMFSRLMGGPTYGLTLHNPLATFGGNQAAKWSNASYGIAITEQIRAQVEEDLRGNLPPDIAVAPMGVQVHRFIRKVPYAGHVAGQRFRLVCCARLNYAKGHLDLLDAVGSLKTKGHDVELLIAGEDDQGGTGFRRAMEQRITELGLDERVSLLGAKSEDQVRELLETAHAFVLASHEEPLGVALMEAMSMELPVVATDAGGVPSLITHGVEGLLVPPRDAQSLASAIATLMADAQRCVALGKAGRVRVEEGFSSRRSAQVVCELSRKALGQG